MLSKEFPGGSWSRIRVVWSLGLTGNGRSGILRYPARQKEGSHIAFLLVPCQPISHGDEAPQIRNIRVGFEPDLP